MCFRKSDAGEERGEYQQRKIFGVMKQQNEQEQQDSSNKLYFCKTYLIQLIFRVCHVVT